ncbi:hypothetical protein F01_50099 [Burkholderia cenocepacia]|nr:hypothetical protein F01_50099 [Burkholderia cenocepacia]
MRRHDRSELGRDGPVLAGRARRTRAVDPAVPGRCVPRSRRKGDRRAAADDAAPGRDPRVARGPRRTDQGARHGRGVPDRQRHRAGTPRNLGAGAAAMGPADPPRGRDLPRPLHEREPRRLLRRPEPRAADVAHRALLVAARRVRLHQALEPDRGQRGRRADARRDRVRARLRRRTAGARKERRVPDEGLTAHFWSGAGDECRAAAAALPTL